jgi:GTPase involved in cell partitioning and DNA repair
MFVELCWCFVVVDESERCRQNKVGEKGEDLVIRVPSGTVVTTAPLVAGDGAAAGRAVDDSQRRELADLVNVGDRVVVAL